MEWDGGWGRKRDRRIERWETGQRKASHFQKTSNIITAESKRLPTSLIQLLKCKLASSTLTICNKISHLLYVSLPHSHAVFNFRHLNDLLVNI